MSQEFFDKLVQTLEISNKKALEDANKRQTDDIKGYINSEITNLRTSLEREINRKTEEIEQKYLELKSKYDKLEKELRKNNIIIFGLETPQENLCDFVVRELNKYLSLNLEKQGINNVFTIGKQTTKRPIIVKFTSYLQKQEVLRNCNKLKGTQISISEELTLDERKQRKILWQHLKKARAENLNTFIRGNILFINGQAYTAQQLADQEEDTDSEEGTEAKLPEGNLDLLNSSILPSRQNNSAPSTPTQHKDQNTEDLFNAVETGLSRKRKTTAENSVQVQKSAKIITRSTSTREQTF